MEILENENKGLIVKDFDELNANSNSKVDMYTTIEDNVKIFNLENSCDKKLNDMKGQVIEVKDILLKRILKPLKNPVINEETGEIEKENEIKLVTIFIDKNDVSYVTGSNSFGFQMIKFIQIFGINKIKEGVSFKITEKTIKNSPNKVLSFELL